MVSGLAGPAALCSGAEAGSYSRLIDCVHHSTLGLRVIKKKRTRSDGGAALHLAPERPEHPRLALRHALGFGVWGLGFGVQSVGCGVWGVGFGV